ncbi:hypothetical protein [Desulfobacter postgatei]|jgi:hypothetical protein|uniref:hypothetical protein n=1 Tax=Desulfobacter postgatei TaxID=2293 RepID=UPI002A361427|nr:hypothetical protein [Desulfobacter postgatei]MDX9963708.1 hypothetical protein [Desulfobacter postgatei]
MTSCLVFNHHSLPFDSPEKVDEAVPDFLKMCLKAKNIGLGTILVDESIDKDWFRLELSGRYFWQDWHNKMLSGEDGTAKDQIRAFRSIVTRQPFFSMEDIENFVDLFEVSFNDDTSFEALRAAAWHDAPLAGFPTRSPWLVSPIHVSVTQLDPDGEIRKSLLELINFYAPGVFEQHSRALLEKRNDSIRSGRVIFHERETLFPGLIFCGKAPQQLRNWSSGHIVLDQVKEALTALNQFCGVWGDDDFAAYHHDALKPLGLNHEVSGESSTVLNNPRLRAEREFWLPCGQKEVFQNHVKLNNGFRLHFFPEPGSKKIYVGYIGPHLKLK